MKSIESRILKLASKNDPNLVILCRNWMYSYDVVEKDESKLPDPVTCIKNVHERKMRAAIGLCMVSVFMLIISLVINNSHLEGYTSYLFKLFVLIEILCVSLWRLFFWPYNCEKDVENASEFVKAIKDVESCGMGDDLSLWDLGDVKEDVKNRLRQDAALNVHFLRGVPWRTGEAEKNFEAWKSRHAAMKRLFPNLPAEYGEYFPPVTSSVKSTPAPDDLTQ